MAGVFGQQRLSSGNTPFNELSFLFEQMLGRLNVATLVKVVAVHSSGRTAAVGTVDVTPLVHQVDGSGNPWPHATIYGIPFFRIQGGANAVICDPHPGDVGFCVFADRDLSSVKASGGAAANPGSDRRFDLADGLFFGGWNPGTAPARFIVVDDAGVTIDAGSASAEVKAGSLTINCDVTIHGKLTATGDVVGNGHNLSTHVHPGVTPGGGSTGGPVG